jgi:CBS domain-containing protein
MRARQLAGRYPVVTLETLALDAAKLMAGNDLPGLIVVDGDGLPCTVLPGTQVLRLAVPSYIQDDPTLAGVVDEATADTFVSTLGQRTVREILPDDKRELPSVDGDATLLEVAALMARLRSPVVAVVDDGRLLGAITVDGLFDRVLGT